MSIFANYQMDVICSVFNQNFCQANLPGFVYILMFPEVLKCVWLWLSIPAF